MVGEAQIAALAVRAAGAASERIGFFGLLSEVTSGGAGKVIPLSENVLPSAVAHKGQDCMVYVNEVLGLFRSTPKMQGMGLQTESGVQAVMQARPEKNAFDLFHHLQSGKYEVSYSESNPVLRTHFPKLSTEPSASFRPRISELVAEANPRGVDLFLNGGKVTQPFGVKQEIGHEAFLTLHSRGAATLELPAMNLEYTSAGTTARIQTGLNSPAQNLALQFDTRGMFQGLAAKPHASARWEQLRYDSSKGLIEVNAPRAPYLQPEWKVVRSVDSY